ncbi:hypothetical protein [Amycolatopsis sp. NPDC004378]
MTFPVGKASGAKFESGAAKDDLVAELDVFLTAEGFPVDYYESDNEFT